MFAKCLLPRYFHMHNLSLKTAFIPYIQPSHFVSCLQERYFLMNTFYLGRKNWGWNEASPLCDCVLIGIQGWKLVWQQLGPQWANGQNGHCCKARSCCSLAQTARMSEQHGVKQQCQSLVLCWWNPKRTARKKKVFCLPRPLLDPGSGD